MKTVANAVAMKVIVAAIERADPRDIPQTPWPLVQPFPKTDPNPTKRPAMARAGPPAEMTWSGIVPVNAIHIGAVINRPNTKVIP